VELGGHHPPRAGTTTALAGRDFPRNIDTTRRRVVLIEAEISMFSTPIIISASLAWFPDGHVGLLRSGSLEKVSALKLGVYGAAASRMQR